MDPPSTPTSSSSRAHSKQKHISAQPMKVKNDDHTSATLTIATSRHTHLSKQIMRKNNDEFNSRSNNFHHRTKHPRRNNNHHHKKRNAAKIVKGEIHNVCLTMRSDPRYYYSNNHDDGVKSRFEYEDCHPILMGLRNLHDLLSSMEVDGTFVLSSSLNEFEHGEKKHIQGKRRNESLTDEDQQQTLMSSSSTNNFKAITFVSPFTEAVCSADITAKTTGAALSALHKFIVYGFIGGSQDSGRYKIEKGISSSLVPSSLGEGDAVRQSITLIAECIHKCCFEGYCNWNDTTCNKVGLSTATSSGRGMFPFWSRSNNNGNDNKGNTLLNESEENIKHELPPFLALSRRRGGSKSNGSSGSNTPSRVKKKQLNTRVHSSQNQDVILKLLSLSVQVLRCPAGREYLSCKDIIGIFDTCLHVAILIAGEHDSLLRSAAADALSHCVIVVFGMRGEHGSKHRHGMRERGSYFNGGGNNSDDDESDSDDDWGERDPTEELTNDNSSESYDHGDANSNVNGQKGISNWVGRDESKLDDNKSDGDDELPLVPIMHRLAILSDPLIHEDNTCELALSLINIALETMSDLDELAERYPRLLSIMQNDLCRNLLRLSTSNDLSILGLALRVIFNLFNGIKDHLKVQLEVFLTSVHLRTLSFSLSPQTQERIWACSPERRELALESLLEFCREPMLMADLYLNYDCDMNCTNLFETICATLCSILVEHSKEASSSIDDDDSIAGLSTKPKLNILNRLALEGILAVIDAIARKCRSSPKFNVNASIIEPTNIDSNPVALPSPPDSGNSDFLGNTLYIRSDSLSESFEFENIDGDLNHSDASESEWSVAQNVLRERKIHKRRLAKAATEFNERSRDKEWIKEAERVGALPNPATPSSVALFLFSTPKLDKAKIGLYLSKGPKDKYPFHNNVLEEFVKLFDFNGMSFSDALRSFLSRFRLPGEAQCIDRLMESFANRLYEVSNRSEPGDENNEVVKESMLDPPYTSDSINRPGAVDPPAAVEEETDNFPFRSADSAFILSFSTIMLNTDLHNPNMKDEKRMTMEQFIRNNRGINDGVDLPVDFLTNLYNEIKSNEIQVKQDLLQDGINNFDGLLANASDVAQPFFTSSNTAHQLRDQVSIHERDMFVSISSAAIEAISAVYVDSWDDALVVKALNGLRSCAFVAAYFQLSSIFNHVLEMMLGFGSDYVTSVATFMYSEVGPGEDFGRVESELVAREIPPLPQSFPHKFKGDSVSQSVFHHVNYDGSAAHRGLLSLDCALDLARDNLAAMDGAWPMLLDALFALREVQALPPSLSELDDFADSRGNPLRPSIFARDCQSRVIEYRESLAPKHSKGKKFWTSLFEPSWSTQSSNDNEASSDDFPIHATLQNVVDATQFDKFIGKIDDISLANSILLALVEGIIPDEDNAEATSDPLFENNAVFVLELLARFLISNRSDAADLYPLFLSKIEIFFLPNEEEEDLHKHRVLGLKFPFILERIIVTILRFYIHFFDIESGRLRENLNRSLRLLTQLPTEYLREVSDRLGCGSAIILRGCFFLFNERAEDWSIIKSLLNLAAQDRSGRSFVFDGIASVIDSIDYTLPSGEENNDGNELLLSQCGVEVIASLLLALSNGSYEGDLSFREDAMSYITKVYSYSQHFGTVSTEDSVDNEKETMLQQYDFHSMVTAIYNDACLSSDGRVAKRGFESLQGIVQSTKMDSIPVERWLNFLEMVTSNPPSLSKHEARISSLQLIGRLFLTLMPTLSNEKEIWSQLEDFTISSALLVHENLRSGRTTTLFESTVQTITNVVNVMSMPKEISIANVQGENFCAWVSETLLFELEQVGACGGVNNGRR